MAARPKDTVAVITGASSGIGRATARAFARGGSSSVVLVARRAAALERVAKECREAGAEALAVPLDVGDADAVERLARQVVTRFGRIDVWVNNASVVGYGRVEEMPAQVWQGIVRTNLFGAYHGTRAVIPWFREQGHGVLINVSSILGRTGSPFQSAYVASKHGIRALSDCVRQELADVEGINVCTVLPGPVDTPLFRSGANYTGLRVVPPGAPVDPRRVAAAIVRCALKPKREVVVGAATRLGLLSERLAPALTEVVSARAIDRGHFDRTPAGRTDGNVLEPRPDITGVSDGWRREKARRNRGPLLAAGGAAVAIAVAARRRSAS